MIVPNLETGGREAESTGDLIIDERMEKVEESQFVLLVFCLTTISNVYSDMPDVR